MILQNRIATMLLLLLIASPLRQAVAQAPQQKTVAVMSVTSVSGMLDGIKYLTEAAGQAGFGDFAAAMVGQYVEGWDTVNPIGMVLTTDGQQEFSPLAFIPVKDLGKALGTMEEQFGAARDMGDGIKELPMGQPVYLKQQGNYAFIGQSVEALATPPVQPAALLGTMPQDYDIALRGNVQNIPAAYLDMAVNALRGGMQQGLEQLPDEDREAQGDLLKMQMEQVERFIKESDAITIGWKTAPADKRTYLDMSFTAVPGSTLAKQMNLMGNAKTNFSGFALPDAAMSMNLTSEIPPEQIEASVNALENLKATAMRELDKDDDIESPESRKAAKELLTAAMDIFLETLKSGKMDGGMSLVLKPQDVSMLAGFQVADGKEVEKVLRRAAEIAKDEPDFPGVKFNADKQGDVAFHTMVIPVPEEEEARKVLGDSLTLAIGSGPQSAYLGVGKDCVAKLKAIIASQPKQKPVRPFELTVSLKPVMEFVASMEENPIIGSIVEALRETGDKDHFRIQGIPVENGFTYRIELEEGIVRAIGQGIVMGNAGGF